MPAASTRHTVEYQSALVAIDKATQGGGLTFTHVCTGSDRYLLVELQIASQVVTGSTVTYNGVSMALLKRQFGGVTGTVELWGLVNPAAGSHSVVITLSGSAGTAEGATSFNGVDQTTPTTSPLGSNGNTSTAHGPAQITADEGMIVEAIVTGSFTPTAPTLQAWNDGGGDGAAYLPGDTTSQQTAYSTPANNWGIASVILNAVGKVAVAGTAYTDSGTPVVGITPSAVETAQFADAATVTMAISPVGVTDNLLAERFLDTTSGDWGTVDEGSLSPTGWTQVQGPTGDVSSGGGFGSVAAAGATTYRLNAGVSLPAAFEIQGTFKTGIPASANIQGFPCWFYQDNSNHYRAQLFVNSSAQFVMQIQKVVAGTVTNIGSTGTQIAVTTVGTYTSQELFNWKLIVNGSSYIFKVWDIGTTEPSNSPGGNTTSRFAVDTATDATYTNGDFGFIITGNAATVNFGAHVMNALATATAYTDAETPVVAITPSATEGLEHVDAATVNLAITPSAADTAQFVDSATPLVTVTPSAADIAQFVDTGTPRVSITPSTVEVGIGHTDAVTVLVDIQPDASTEVGIIHTDAATVGLVVTPSSVETAQFVDAATVGLIVTPSAVETAQDVDSATARVTFTPSATEVAAFTDSATVRMSVDNSASTEFQTSGAVDAVTIPIAITPSATESAQFVDTGTVGITLTPSSTDAAVFVDSATVLVDIDNSASVEVGIIHTDAGTVGIAVTPSSTDVAAYIEAATVPVALTPSVVEGTVHTDSATVPVALTLSGADTGQKVESGTVRLTLTPDSTEIYGASAADADTAKMFITVSDVSFMAMTEATTVPIALTPSGTEIKERAYLDSGEADILITVDGTEFIAKEEIATVFVVLQPGLLYEFQGDGDVLPIHITPSVMEGFLFQDAAQVYLQIDGDASEAGSSFSTFGTVLVDIQPATDLEFALLTDSATVALLITPHAVIEVKIIADYLLVGTLSKHYTAVLRDNAYILVLGDTRYTLDLSSGWATTWHGRGDE